MDKKIIVVLIVVALATLGGYVFFAKAPAAPSAKNAPANSSQETGTPPQESKNTPPQTSETPKVVTYTDSGYEPKTITVKTGEAVTFKNQSSKSMWPASAMHPTHRVYPTTGGCLGSTFDACRGVQPGDSWSFTFDFAGSWKYHDHLAPSASNSGTIIVE